MLLTVLYFLTRLYNLTLLPIFTDEAVYIHLAKIIAVTKSQFFISLVNGKPPLLTWLNALVLSITPSQDYLLYSRLLNVLIGFIGVVGVYKLTKLLFKSAKVSLLSTYLYILSPFIVFYDRLMLFDTLLLVSSLWVFYFAFKTIKTRNYADAILWGLSLAFCFYSKPPALFVWLMSVAIFLFVIKQITRKALFLTLVASIIGQLFNNLLRLSSGYKNFEQLTNSYSIFDSLTTVNVIDLVTTNVSNSLYWIFSFYTPLVLIIGLLGFILLIYSRRRLGLALFFVWAAPFAIFSLIAEIYLPRYVLFSTPFILIACGYLLTKLNKVIAVLTLATMTTFLLQFVFLIVNDPPSAPLPKVEKEQYVTGMASGYGLSPIFNYLKKESAQRPIELVVSGSLSNFPSAFVLEFFDDKNVKLLDEGIDVISYWDESKEKPGTFAAVRSRKTNLHKDIINELNLKVILKGEKPGGKDPFYLTTF